jgi:phosphocarrier protein HPr
MIRRRVNIVNQLGLHARAAARFVKIASSYRSDVWLVDGDHKVNGKSIMGLMMLAAAKGTSLELRVSGDDERDATDALVELVDSGFGEEE